MLHIIIGLYMALGLLLTLSVASYRDPMLNIINTMRNRWQGSKFVVTRLTALGIVMIIFWVISVPLLKRQVKRNAFNELMTALDAQNEQIHDPDTGYRERRKGESYDPVEDEPEFQAVIDGVRAEANRRLELHPWRNGRGYCHPRWKTIKLILREEHGIHWRTPVEMNPHICYD